MTEALSDGERVCAIRDGEGRGSVPEFVEHEAVELCRLARLRPDAPPEVRPPK
jgi:hypothetical protein